MTADFMTPLTTHDNLTSQNDVCQTYQIFSHQLLQHRNNNLNQTVNPCVDPKRAHALTRSLSALGTVTIVLSVANIL